MQIAVMIDSNIEDHPEGVRALLLLQSQRCMLQWMDHQKEWRSDREAEVAAPKMWERLNLS
jgi:hypothetical protein